MIISLTLPISEQTTALCFSGFTESVNATPAGSRGLLVSSIPSGSRWLNGPAFLFLPKEKWPKWNSMLAPLNDPQAQERTVTWIGAVKDSKDKYFFPAKYSSLTKFLKVTVYPAWFISNCRLSSYLRFHTGLCKVLRNISTNIWSLGKRKSLKLREVPSLFIFYNITIALLIPLDGFRFFYYVSENIWSSTNCTSIL